MKITVTETNATLATLLSSSQKTVARNSADWKVYKNLFIQNEDDAVSVYVEFWTASTLTDWFELYPWDTIAFQDGELEDVNLIADWATNSNIKILIN